MQLDDFRRFDSVDLTNIEDNLPNVEDKFDDIEEKFDDIVDESYNIVDKFYNAVDEFYNVVDKFDNVEDDFEVVNETRGTYCDPAPNACAAAVFTSYFCGVPSKMKMPSPRVPQ